MVGEVSCGRSQHARLFLVVQLLLTRGTAAHGKERQAAHGEVRERCGHGAFEPVAQRASWAAARREAGLNLTAEPPGLGALLRRLNNFSGPSLAMSFDGRCVIYASVFKAANNAIRQTILDALPSYFHRTNPTRLIADKLAPDQAIALLNSDARNCQKGTLAFTFVREPLSHFISGFTELMWRRSPYYRDCTRPPCADEDATNTNIAAAEQLMVEDASRFVRGLLLDGEAVHWDGLTDHISLMSGVLIGTPTIDFVGRLESAESDWREMLRRAAVPSGARRREGAQFPSVISLDPWLSLLSPPHDGCAFLSDVLTMPPAVLRMHSCVLEHFARLRARQARHEWT
jgi:hypothetical protein